MNKKITKLLKNRLKSLRPDQREAFDEMQRETLLQLCYPCGFGKGYIIGTDVINSIVNRIIKNQNPQKHALLSHRLALNEQHISELFSILKYFVGHVAFAFVGSEGGLSKEDTEDKELTELIRKLNDTLPDNKRIAAKQLIVRTTKTNELLDFFRTHNDKDIVIISTYHSSCILGNQEININTLHCDEAHELASDFISANKENSFANNFLKIKSLRKFFYTATPKDSSEDTRNTFLMNNVDIFGRRIGMSHVEAVEKGYLLPTTVEVLYPSSYNSAFNIDYGSIENKAYICCRAFERDKEWLKEVSAHPDKIGSKILVRCSSVEKDMWPIFNALKKYLPKGVKLFASASKDDNGAKIHENAIYMDSEMLSYDKKNGFTKRNGKLSRKDYIKALQSLKDNEEAIILHHDTISEGINFPGFTCLVPLTDTLIDFAKLYQNLGRILRLHTEDKEKLRKGLLEVFGGGWIKPEAHVIIPYWSNVSDKATENIVNIIINLETNIGAKLATEIPYGSPMATGYGQEPEISHRIRKDNRTQITTDLTCVMKFNREMEIKKRMQLNSEFDKKSFREGLEFLNNL